MNRHQITPATCPSPAPTTAPTPLARRPGEGAGESASFSQPAPLKLQLPVAASGPSTINPQLSTVPQPDYVLRKGLGFWELTFQGRSAVVKHEQGLYYVACLLLNPPAEPLHGLALSLRAAALYGRPVGPGSIINPLTGEILPLALDAAVEQRSLGIEEADAAFALRRKQLELEAILDDPDQIEPVKAEVLRELEGIYAYQKQKPGRTTDAAQRTVHAVRVAILRLHEHLARAVDATGQAHPVLRPFAEHLERYLLTPSRRHARPGPRSLRSGVAGCFIYEAPAGVVWRA